MLPAAKALKPVGETLLLAVLRLKAVLLLATGCRHAALVSFDQILQRLPADPHALASRANACARLHDYAQAVLSLRRLTQSCSLDSSAWFNLGYALQQIGQHDEAGSSFRRALDLDPRLDRAWYGLGLVLMGSRQFQGAIDAFLQVTALQPMGPHGWFRLAQARHALGQRTEVLRIIGHLRGFEPRVAAQLELATEDGEPALHQSAFADSQLPCAPTELTRYAA